MANYKWSITFQDVGQPPQTATAEGYFVGADQAAALAYIQGIAEALNNPAPAGAGALPLTLGKIISVNLSQAVDYSGWVIRPAAVAGAENQKGGRFIFATGLNYNTRMTIPTFNEALKLSTGYIDLTNPAVFAFYQTGVIDGGGADNRYDDLTVLNEAYFTYGGKPAPK